MKILLINDYSTPTGGAEKAFLTLRRDLIKQGHEVRFFSTTASEGKGERSADVECFGTVSRFRTLLQTANPWAYFRLKRLLAEYQPDVVHVKVFLTQLSPLILPLLKKIPTLHHVVWYRPICPLGTKMLPDGSICREPAGRVCYQKKCLPLWDWLPIMFQMKLLRMWRNVFDITIANSESTKTLIMKEGFGPVEVILNGVPKEPNLSPLPDTPAVFFAGRLVYEKGVDLLVKAFQKVLMQVPHAKLYIAGQGPEEPFLRKLIDTLGISENVQMLGFLNQEDVRRFIAQSWVQAVPSRWEEPFGFVAIEAMMNARAVIASAGGGLTEIIQHGENGFQVPMGDESALAEALQKVLSQRELARRMGENGRRTALSRFTTEIHNQKFLTLYEKLLKKEAVIHAG